MLLILPFFRFVEFNGYGDIYYEFVDERGPFQVKVWKAILESQEHKDFLQPILDKKRFSFLLHDNCMNGAKPVDTLDTVFGPGNWGTPPPPPCRKITGYRLTQVRASAKRKAHVRRVPIYQTHRRCHCTLPLGAQAAKIPDVNRAEKLFNLIEEKLKTQGRDNGWPKNRQELKERISNIIERTPKSWFVDCFATLPETWEKMIARKGKLTEDYIPKYN